MASFMHAGMLAATAMVVVGGYTVSSFAATPGPSPDVGGGRIYGDVARGKEYTERWCVTCHAVGEKGTDGAPPLALLKKDPKKTDAYIRGFLAIPHKPMPPLALTTQEVEDIIAYLRAPG